MSDQTLSTGSGETRPLRVAIVGGGIGGLAAANALVRHGAAVTVFEQAASLGEVGAGIMMYPNSLRLLERLGFGPALAAVGGAVGEGSRYCRKDGATVGPVLTTDTSGWNGMYGMHRADLLNALAAALPAGTVETGKRCVDFTQDADAATLHFADGTEATADVVVAADGIKSVLQGFVVPPATPEYSGVRAYRGIIARDRLAQWRDGTHQVWMGDGKHFMVFPVRGGAMLNYVGFVPTGDAVVESWSAVGDRDELADSFADFDPEITALLGKVETCFWWGLYDRRPLDRWTAGRLVLIGDAAHPMLPHLGQGANQSIEDGVALAVMLDGCAPDEVPAALERFEQLRKPRTDLIQAEARRNGLRYDSKYDSLEQRDAEIRASANFRAMLYDYDVEAAAQIARDTPMPEAA